MKPAQAAWRCWCIKPAYISVIILHLGSMQAWMNRAWKTKQTLRSPGRNGRSVESFSNVGAVNTEHDLPCFFFPSCFKHLPCKHRTVFFLKNKTLRRTCLKGKPGASPLHHLWDVHSVHVVAFCQNWKSKSCIRHFPSFLVRFYEIKECVIEIIARVLPQTEAVRRAGGWSQSLASMFGAARINWVKGSTRTTWLRNRWSRL